MIGAVGHSGTHEPGHGGAVVAHGGEDEVAHRGVAGVGLLVAQDKLLVVVGGACQGGRTHVVGHFHAQLNVDRGHICNVGVARAAGGREPDEGGVAQAFVILVAFAALVEVERLELLERGAGAVDVQIGDRHVHRAASVTLDALAV